MNNDYEPSHNQVGGEPKRKEKKGPMVLLSVIVMVSLMWLVSAVYEKPPAQQCPRAIEKAIK